MSDCCSSNNKVSELQEGYHHYTVNHIENLVESTTAAHNEKIESASNVA